MARQVDHGRIDDEALSPNQWLARIFIDRHSALISILHVLPSLKLHILAPPAIPNLIRGRETGAAEQEPRPP